VKELETTVDPTRAGPAADPALFPAAPAAPLWTSSPLAGSTAQAWTVDFSLGSANTMDASTAFRARCVR
jgi:hypothetical protein